jgi:hypothetical protein
LGSGKFSGQRRLSAFQLSSHPAQEALGIIRESRETKRGGDAAVKPKKAMKAMKARTLRKKKANTGAPYK